MNSSSSLSHALSSRNVDNFAISLARISTISLVTTCGPETTTNHGDFSERTTGGEVNVRSSSQNCDNVAIGDTSDGRI